MGYRNAHMSAARARIGIAMIIAQPRNATKQQPLSKLIPLSVIFMRGSLVCRVDGGDGLVARVNVYGAALAIGRGDEDEGNQQNCRAAAELVFNCDLM